MKTSSLLPNVSPFLLLLVPVFVMMLLTFATGNSANRNEELAVKAASGKNSLTKVVNTINK